MNKAIPPQELHDIYNYDDSGVNVKEPTIKSEAHPSQAVQKPRNFEDVIERSRELGLNLPKNQMESIRVSIEEKKIPVETHIQQIEKIADRHNEKGYGWHIREDHNPKYPLLYFIDKHNQINAYVVERSNSQTTERFYAANRINEKGEHLKITSNNSLEAVKNHVTAYYTGATIRELATEMSKGAEKQPKIAIQKPEARKSSNLELSR